MLTAVERRGKGKGGKGKGTSKPKSGILSSFPFPPLT
jgi:hypothetical protein